MARPRVCNTLELVYALGTLTTFVIIKKNTRDKLNGPITSHFLQHFSFFLGIEPLCGNESDEI